MSLARVAKEFQTLLQAIIDARLNFILVDMIRQLPGNKIQAIVVTFNLNCSKKIDEKTYYKPLKTKIEVLSFSFRLRHSASGWKAEMGKNRANIDFYFKMFIIIVQHMFNLKCKSKSLELILVSPISLSWKSSENKERKITMLSRPPFDRISWREEIQHS